MESSVIVPCTRPEKARATLAALLCQSVPAGEYEVVAVVPDESVKAAIEQPRVRVVVAGQLYGPGKMRNIGASHSSGRSLFFLDDDCIPPPTWLAALRARLSGDGSTGVVGCRVVSLRPSFWTGCADHALFSAYQYDASRSIDLGSAAIGVPREVFDAVGGFDEDLLATEDWDFCLKVREKGRRCFFDAGVEVKHDHECDSLGKIVTKAYRYGYRSGVVVQARHLGKMSWLAALSVRLSHPAVYWLLVAPYVFSGLLLQTLPSVRRHASVLLYVPFLLLARSAYHVGVWRRLMRRVP